MNRASRRNFLPAPAFKDFKKLPWGFADDEGRIYRVLRKTPEGWAVFDSDQWSAKHHVAYVWYDGRTKLEPGESVMLANSEQVLEMTVENTFPTQKKVESLIVVLH